LVRLDGRQDHHPGRVHALSGYSAHADQEGLIEWVESMGDKPKRIKLVHGEPAAWKCLAEMLRTLECSVD